MGSLLNSAYRHELSPHMAGLPASLVEVARGSVAGAVAVAGHMPAALGSPLLTAARDAYGVGMSDVLRVCAAVMIVAALSVAVFMRRARSAYDPGRESSASWADAHAQAE
jgi:DHA2 family multidrug resistance protein-like MFS transporter